MVFEGSSKNRMVSFNRRKQNQPQTQKCHVGYCILTRFFMGRCCYPFMGNLFFQKGRKQSLWEFFSFSGNCSASVLGRGQSMGMAFQSNGNLPETWDLKKKKKSSSVFDRSVIYVRLFMLQSYKLKLLYYDLSGIENACGVFKIFKILDSQTEACKHFNMFLIQVLLSQMKFC